MRTIQWVNGQVQMVDQRKLPWELTYVTFTDYRDVAHAITEMVVRGAPAIGASAAFGMALAGRQCNAQTVVELLNYLQVASVIMKEARPTAVNLAWAVDRIMQVARAEKHRSVFDIQQALLAEAQCIADDDVTTNQRMGMLGAALIHHGDTVLHHCNTGSLATVDYGTALGVIRTAHEQAKKFHVLLTETRPRLQGARLSAWELHSYGVPFEIIPDSAAGYYMRQGDIKICFVGADRVAANGDTINKIGTYSLAVLAHANNIPFYVVSPTSTVDLHMPNGDQVPIELRAAEEVNTPYGHALTPTHFPVRNPAFDITPERYITGIITENGIAFPPYRETLAQMVQASKQSAL